MYAARAQPGEMPLADQQPGRRGLLLLRERTSQRIALLPGARAHCISVGRSAAQQRGCVSIPPQPRRRETRCTREASFNHFVRGNDNQPLSPFLFAFFLSSRVTEPLSLMLSSINHRRSSALRERLSAEAFATAAAARCSTWSR